MSTAFTQFLRELAQRESAMAKANQAIIDEWREAVHALFGQIRSWLADSDPDHVIEIKEGKEEIREGELGRYVVPRLDLRVFGKWIGIIPKARHTVGVARPPQSSAPKQASGRVDITNELRRFVLYRFPRDGGGDQWLIDDIHTEADPRPLDQQTFEAALMNCLR